MSEDNPHPVEPHRNPLRPNTLMLGERIIMATVIELREKRNALWEQTKKQVTDLKEKMSTEVDRQSQSVEDYKKLQEKLVEMENAYFDLQMENVNLKNELKSLKRMNSEDEL